MSTDTLLFSKEIFLKQLKAVTNISLSSFPKTFGHINEEFLKEAFSYFENFAFSHYNEKIDPNFLENMESLLEKYQYTEDEMVAKKLFEKSEVEKEQLFISSQKEISPYEDDYIGWLNLLYQKIFSFCFVRLVFSFHLTLSLMEKNEEIKKAEAL